MDITKDLVAERPPEVFPLLGCACLRSPHDDDVGCVCLREERFLRHVIGGRATMTPEQREWCMREIIAVEGYCSEDAEGSDVDVARTVLSAWTDYVRDKGMI